MGWLLSFIGSALSVFGCSESLGPWDTYISIAPSGQELAFVGAGRGVKDLYRLSLKELRVTKVTDSRERELDVSYSPDRKTMVFTAMSAAGKAGHIYLCSLDGGVRRQLTGDAALYDSEASFSPDGRQLLFARGFRRRPYAWGGWTWVDWDVCVMHCDGTHLRRITHENFNQMTRPRFSPDGRHIVFSGYGGGESNLYLTDPEGATPPKLLPAGLDGRSPDWSPDGKQIIFTADPENNCQPQIYALSPDGGRRRRITSNGKSCAWCVWTPDGRQIYFTVWFSKERGTELWRIGEDGTGQCRVDDQTLFEDPTHWRPDGRAREPSGVDHGLPGSSA